MGFHLIDIVGICYDALRKDFILKAFFKLFPSLLCGLIFMGAVAFGASDSEPPSPFRYAMVPPKPSVEIDVSLCVSALRDEELPGDVTEVTALSTPLGGDKPTPPARPALMKKDGNEPSTQRPGAGIDGAGRARLSSPIVYPSASVRGVTLKGSLMGRDLDAPIEGQAYRPAPRNLAPADRLRWIFSHVLHVDLRIKQVLPAGGMQHVFIAEYTDANGVNISGVVKLLDPGLVEQTSGIDMSSEYHLMAELIQYNRMLMQTGKIAAERFLEELEERERHLTEGEKTHLVLNVLQNEAVSVLADFGVTFMPFAEGTLRKRSTSLLVSNGMERELYALQEFERRYEMDMVRLLAGLRQREPGHFNFSYRASYVDQDTGKIIPYGPLRASDILTGTGAFVRVQDRPGYRMSISTYFDM